MDKKKKGEFAGVLGTLLVHMLLFALLILVTFIIPLPDEEDGGIPVLLGNTAVASGEAEIGRAHV